MQALCTRAERRPQAGTMFCTQAERRAQIGTMFCKQAELRAFRYYVLHANGAARAGTMCCTRTERRAQLLCVARKQSFADAGTRFGTRVERRAHAGTTFCARTKLRACRYHVLYANGATRALIYTTARYAKSFKKRRAGLPAHATSAVDIRGPRTRSSAFKRHQWSHKFKAPCSQRPVKR